MFVQQHFTLQQIFLCSKALNVNYYCAPIFIFDDKISNILYCSFGFAGMFEFRLQLERYLTFKFYNLARLAQYFQFVIVNFFFDAVKDDAITFSFFCYGISLLLARPFPIRQRIRRAKFF